MQNTIHPAYGPVVFRDCSGNLELITRSTLAGSLADDHPRVTVGGATYPVVDVEISSASHPYWTGQGRVIDSEGRVERFRRRYGRN